MPLTLCGGQYKAKETKHTGGNSLKTLNKN